jgi:squalene-hopene/tetraprenyl-beta-curcumene cyclase
MLCRAAFHISDAATQHGDSLRRCETYLAARFGRTPEELAEAVRARYGKDRTFSVPILMTCALAGLVDWLEVPPLPFELACFPQSWFRFLRLPVVSYALPALIAIGQAIYHHRPPRNPITRAIRSLSRKRSLRVLERIQPSSGGFLEATPLTSFVTISLASIGHAEHPVARKAVEFLVKSARPDGSWAIDSNLATWVTTLAVNALASGDRLTSLEPEGELKNWLVKQQFNVPHAYTGAEPGGWGWTDLPGSVPDADDTAGALLALLSMSPANDVLSFDAIHDGIEWLTQVQNADGGMPTFCRGWGNLPFDRSGVDLTAHALRSFKIWRDRLNSPEGIDWLDWLVTWDPFPLLKPKTLLRKSLRRIDRFLRKGIHFLSQHQRPDGSWLPLWFGNQHALNEGNPTYGTARVLAAYRDLDMMDTEPARRGVAWLLDVQNADGGWGGAKNVPSSVEETALAVEVLIDVAVRARSFSDGLDKPVANAPGSDGVLRALTAVNRGLAYLVQQVETGGLSNPTPIGFYFAKLWYFEKLYPIIFTVAALGRALRRLSPHQDTGRLTPGRSPRDQSPRDDPLRMQT